MNPLSQDELEQLTGTGTVYISADLHSSNARPRYFGHWEGDLSGRLVRFEQGPGWDDVAVAIRWARSRTPRVVVRVFVERKVQTFSAGLEQIVDEEGPLPQWPFAQETSN